MPTPSLKHYASPATVAWSPSKLPVPGHAVLAAGTVAGAVDGTFSSSSVLEVGRSLGMAGMGWMDWNGAQTARPMETKPMRVFVCARA